MNTLKVKPSGIGMFIASACALAAALVLIGSASLRELQTASLPAHPAGAHWTPRFYHEPPPAHSLLLSPAVSDRYGSPGPVKLVAPPGLNIG